MTVHVLFYSHDHGDREDWNVLHTPMEVFSTSVLRQARKQALAQQDPDLGFLEQDVQVMCS